MGKCSSGTRNRLLIIVLVLGLSYNFGPSHRNTFTRPRGSAILDSRLTLASSRAKKVLFLDFQLSKPLPLSSKRQPFRVFVIGVSPAASNLLEARNSRNPMGMNE